MGSSEGRSRVEGVGFRGLPWVQKRGFPIIIVISGWVAEHMLRGSVTPFAVFNQQMWQLRRLTFRGIEWLGAALEALADQGAHGVDSHVVAAVKCGKKAPLQETPATAGAAAAAAATATAVTITVITATRTRR